MEAAVRLRRLGSPGRLEFRAFRTNCPDLADAFGKHINWWRDAGSREILIYDLLTTVDAYPEKIEIIQRGLFFGYYICAWATPVHLDPYLYVLLDPEETFFTVLVFRDQRRLQRNRWS